MTPEQLESVLKKYRVNKARLAYLNSQLEMLERFLKISKGQMISDQISLSQAITGMPHGSGTGDPTGRLAIDIASGKVSVFVKQIELEIRDTKINKLEVAHDIEISEIALGALNDREREVVYLKVIDNLSWDETLGDMKRKHGGTYGKRTLQRLLDRAMDKMLETVK